MGFDYTKPVRQKNGRPARIVDFNVKHEKYGLAVVREDERGIEQVEAYGKVTGRYWGDGSVAVPSQNDLENIPE